MSTKYVGLILSRNEYTGWNAAYVFGRRGDILGYEHSTDREKIRNAWIIYFGLSKINTIPCAPRQDFNEISSKAEETF
jgi:hypothetical protein